MYPLASLTDSVQQALIINHHNNNNNNNNNNNKANNNNNNYSTELASEHNMQRVTCIPRARSS